MPRRVRPGLLVVATLGAGLLSLPAAPPAGAQAASGFDGQYVGTLRLVEVISGDCTPPPLGAVYPLTVSGGQVSFGYVPRFATILTGRVAPSGSFRASAPTKLGAVEMTGQIRGTRVDAQIVSPSCLYNFTTAY